MNYYNINIGKDGIKRQSLTGYSKSINNITINTIPNINTTTKPNTHKTTNNKNIIKKEYSEKSRYKLYNTIDKYGNNIYSMAYTAKKIVVVVNNYDIFYIQMMSKLFPNNTPTVYYDRDNYALQLEFTNYQPNEAVVFLMNFYQKFGTLDTVYGMQ